MEREDRSETAEGCVGVTQDQDFSNTQRPAVRHGVMKQFCPKSPLQEIGVNEEMVQSGGVRPLRHDRVIPRRSKQVEPDPASHRESNVPPRP